MKALTKAKRRVPLSVCGLGWLDESEADSIPNASPVRVNTSTGEILDTPPAQQRAARPIGPPAGAQPVNAPMYGSAPPKQAPAAPEPTQAAEPDRGAVTAAAIARIEAAGSLAEIAGIKADLKRAGGLNREQAAEIGKAFALQEADLSLIEQAPA